ncbi:MAG TPA: hypothetical protein VHR47_02855 [Bacillota bacterium]|nr:hypothetical protein [Bacillota bacterium]
MAYRTQLLLFSPTKKVTKKVAGTWRFPEFPSSLKAVLKRPTVYGSENRGNVDALRVAYSLHGPPWPGFYGSLQIGSDIGSKDGAKHRPFLG